MIAEIGKTQIKLRFSFVAAVTLMLYLCDEKVVLCTFCASLFHEGGHLFFMRIFSEVPSYIEFGLSGIRIDRANVSHLSYKKEALVALGGIIFNLSAAVIFYIAYALSGKELCLLISAVNILVAAINSVPNRFLDLGRAFHFFLLEFTSEENAEKIISTVSAVFTVIFGIFWLLYSIFIKINISLSAVTLYLIAITFKRKVGK